jgi:heme exporter protein C
MKTSRNSLIKILAIILLLYSHIGGLLFDVPRLNILNETVRALYFHVPMWFAMVLLFLISVSYSIFYLRKPSPELDTKATAFVHVGFVFGLLGLFTGMLWAKYTWGKAWHGDPKQIGAGVTLLVYLIYFVLRLSVDDREKKARLSAVFNIYAFAAMIPLIFIIPRMYDSLHPGSGGNPGFNAYDLDSRMRMVFYPAVVGWFLIGIWMADLKSRIKSAEERIDDLDDYEFSKPLHPTK